MLPSQYQRYSVLLVTTSYRRNVFKSNQLEYITKLCWSQACSQHSSSSSSSGGKRSTTTTPMARFVTPNLVDTLQSNMNWFNQQYDRVFGIAEIRDIQTRVLEAESNFVDVTQRRKACQDRIETFKEEIKNIRDKLEITPRQSDNYLRLITEEHKLLREQLAMDVQLDQLKENEQLALDNLSKLLRQSHELERLRQERSKYWQIISISLSLAGSLVALIAQRARSQKSVMNRLTSMDEKFLSLEDSLASQKLELDLIAGQMERVSEHLERLSVQLDRRLAFEERDAKPVAAAGQRQSWASWLGSWIPGKLSFRLPAAHLW